MKFRSMFKVRKPGNGQAFQDKVNNAGKSNLKIVADEKVKKFVKTSVKI